MPTLPRANTTVSETATAIAGGVDVVCLISPCATNADITPRQFGSADAVYELHGYSEGVEYAALHAKFTRKPFLFVGIPIVTQGAVGRQDPSGNSGSSVVSVSVGSDGVLAEHEGVVKVDGTGTFTIGVDQIKLQVSADGGRTFKSVRLGTASSYVLPFFNVTITFGAGTLVGGDTVLTWSGSAPRGDAAGWQAAREALAAQLKFFRSIMLFGDMQTDTEASAFNTEIEAYETVNERFIYGRASVYDRSPLAALSRDGQGLVPPGFTLTLAEVGATGDTITRNAGSFISDGFVVGDWVTITGGLNDGFGGRVATVTALVLTFDTADLVDEGPITSSAIIVASSPRINFNEVGATGDTITRSRGSWLADGFRAGDRLTVAGSASNNFTGALVTAVTALTLTLDTQDLVAEELGVAEGYNEFDLSIVAGQTKAQWMAAIDAEFAPVDDAFRINLSAGRGRILSPFSGWYMRRPAGWFDSLEEYKHDLHVATWAKQKGPVGADLFDADNVLVEWDDRVDGEAGTAARFTTLRTWANGPKGAFIARSLTRALDSSLLSNTNKVAVVNLACTIVQLATENAVGRDLVLNDDGTATTDALKTIESEVNAALELALLTNRGEGPRASKAVMTCATDDVFTVPEPVLNTTTELLLNGTIHTIQNKIRVRSGGQ